MNSVHTKRYNRKMNFKNGFGISVLILTGAIILLGAGNLFGQGIQKELFIEWRKVSRASGYSVQIRKQSGEVVLTRRVKTNRINFVLPPGAYQHRIGVMNKFQRVSGWSRWNSFTVIKPKVPVLDKVEHSVKKTKDKSGKDTGKVNIEIAVSGKHFVKSTKARLIDKDGNRIPLSIKRNKEGKMVLVANVHNPKPGKYDLELENPGKKKVRIPKQVAVLLPGKDPGKKPGKIPGKKPGEKPGKEPGKKPGKTEERKFAASSLIPGVGQFKKGNYLKASIWGGLFTSYAIAGASELQRANLSTAASRNNVMLSIFSDPIVLLSLQNQVSADQLVILSATAKQKDSSLRADYNRHLQNQYAIGGLALGTYIAYVLYQNKIQWNWRLPVPGLPQWKQGKKVTAGLWAGAFLTLAAGGISEYQAANREVNSTSRNIFYQVFSNPLAFIGFADTSSSLEGLLLVNLYVDNISSDSRDKYDRHRRNQAAIGVTALGLYVAHLVHSQYVRKRRAPRTAKKPNAPRSFFSGIVLPETNGGKKAMISYHYLF